jgi:hypothetical protein
VQNVGLFNKNAAAKKEILAACATNYAKKSEDYMVTVAKMHAKVRGWLA